jgi:hypothetical protein
MTAYFAHLDDAALARLKASGAPDSPSDRVGERGALDGRVRCRVCRRGMDRDAPSATPARRSVSARRCARRPGPGWAATSDLRQRLRSCGGWTDSDRHTALRSSRAPWCRLSAWYANWAPLRHQADLDRSGCRARVQANGVSPESESGLFTKGDLRTSRATTQAPSSPRRSSWSRPKP